MEPGSHGQTFTLCQGYTAPYPGIFPETHLSRKEGIGVKLFHLGHQVICGKCHILHKLPVKQEPVRATIHSNALWDPPVPQAPHVCIALQEKTVQALFPNEPGQNKLTLSTWVRGFFPESQNTIVAVGYLLSPFWVLTGVRISRAAYCLLFLSEAGHSTSGKAITTALLVRRTTGAQKT